MLEEAEKVCKLLGVALPPEAEAAAAFLLFVASSLFLIRVEAARRAMPEVRTETR